jgi:hypothetical protein
MITPADALIQASDNLTLASAGVIPPSNITTDAIDQLMRIFKQQAAQVKDSATSQRVLTSQAQRQRVLNKAETNSATTVPTAVPTTNIEFPPLEMEEMITPTTHSTATVPTTMPTGRTSNVLVISQDDDYIDRCHFDSPAGNTRQQSRSRTLTQDFIYNAIEFPTSFTQVTPQQAA